MKKLLLIILAVFLLVLTLNTTSVEADSTVYSSYVNFTFNVSDGDSIAGIMNCSLWLLKDGAWNRNMTMRGWIPGDGSNLTFNATLQQGKYNWTIACYDKDEEQTNSSTRALHINLSWIAPIYDYVVKIAKYLKIAGGYLKL